MRDALSTLLAEREEEDLKSVICTWVSRVRGED